MYPTRYFPTRYYPGRFFTHTLPVVGSGGGYYAPRYWVGRYYPGRYFPGTTTTSPTPTPTPSIRQAVMASLLADVAIEAIVGASIFPFVIREQTPLPALTYQLLTDLPGRQLDGADGTSRARFQFAAVSRSPGDCDRLQRAVFDLFESFDGTLPGPVVVTETVVKPIADQWTMPVDGTQAGKFRTLIDVIFTYRTPKPSR